MLYQVAEDGRVLVVQLNPSVDDAHEVVAPPIVATKRPFPKAIEFHTDADGIVPAAHVMPS